MHPPKIYLHKKSKNFFSLIDGQCAKHRPPINFLD